MKIKILSCFLVLALGLISCKAQSFTEAVYADYESYKEEQIKSRRFKHADIQPLIDAFRNKAGFSVAKVGTSIEGRALNLISIGEGETDVFFWSQMHGNESTATMAVFDMLNFLASKDYQQEKKLILSNLKLHFLPMLNPDGAEVFQRRNRLGIDINRDALRLQSPEGRTLKGVRDSLDADYGFNLHDQSWYYNAERTDRPATISYLAPPINYEKDIDSVRANAMRVIVFMNRVLQQYAPGQVGRYSDDFEPRAFGDNIQKWGTSTILIESGGYDDDKQKQEIRKLNFVSILSAVYTIAAGEHQQIDIAEYETIPHNDRKLFDLKIENIGYPLLDKEYILDLGIYQNEVELPQQSEYWVSSRIIDQGDLSTYYGYQTLNATGMSLTKAKVYPKVFGTISETEGLNYWDLLRQGYAYLKVAKLPADLLSSPLPLHLVSPDFTNNEPLNIEVGINPTFMIMEQDKMRYAVVNGFLFDLQSQQGQAKNTMIFRTSQ